MRDKWLPKNLYKGGFHMKELIPRDEYGVFADTRDVARVDSRYVAQAFEREHKNVLRDIANITGSKSGLSKNFAELNFERSTYKDPTGRKLPCYLLTRDGFTMLAMGYTGQKAMHFKELYIHRFNEMEQFIDTLVHARDEFPLLTEQIKLLHDNPKPYHFSNECDMINRIVLGKSAKQFRDAYGIPKGESIRPHLTDEQLSMINLLQKLDYGLMLATPNFQERKQLLINYVMKKASLQGGTDDGSR